MTDIPDNRLQPPPTRPLIRALENSPNELITKNFAKYYPEEANFWMYAMIVLGLSFIVFVALTIYKLWNSKNETTKNHKRSESMMTGPPTTIAQA